LQRTNSLFAGWISFTSNKTRYVDEHIFTLPSRAADGSSLEILFMVNLFLIAVPGAVIGGFWADLLSEASSVMYSTVSNNILILRDFIFQLGAVGSRRFIVSFTDARMRKVQRTSITFQIKLLENNNAIQVN
jgi:hypothetical protein